MSSFATTCHGSDDERSAIGGIAGDEHIVGKLLTTFYDNIAIE